MYANAFFNVRGSHNLSDAYGIYVITSNPFIVM